MRVSRFAALLTLCWCLVVGASAARVSDFPDFPELFQPEDGEVLTVVIENDMFGGTDRHYTNGLRLEWVSAAEAVSP